jgi:hypothetical protein
MLWKGLCPLRLRRIFWLLPNGCRQELPGIISVLLVVSPCCWRERDGMLMRVLPTELTTCLFGLPLSIRSYRCRFLCSLVAAMHRLHSVSVSKNVMFWLFLYFFCFVDILPHLRCWPQMHDYITWYRKHDLSHRSLAGILQTTQQQLLGCLTCFGNFATTCLYCSIRRIWNHIFCLLFSSFQLLSGLTSVVRHVLLIPKSVSTLLERRENAYRDNRRLPLPWSDVLSNVSEWDIL